MATPPCDLSPPPGCLEACQACPSVPSQCLQGVYAFLQAYRQAYRPAPQASASFVHRSFVRGPVVPSVPTRANACQTYQRKSKIENVKLLSNFEGVGAGSR